MTSFTYKMNPKKYYLLFSKWRLLKQIVDNTEPKRSFSIVVSDNKTRFKTWFRQPIQLDKKKDYEIALIKVRDVSQG